MSPDGLSRGVPAQDLPENQDPSVRFTINEQTGLVTPWPEPELEASSKKKRPAKKTASPVDAGERGDGPADDAESGDPGAEKAAAITSVREVGS